MAPEQWSQIPVDGRADQYSLGIVLYEMVAGRRPFQGDYPALYAQHREAPIPPLPIDLQVPNAVEQVIRRATQKSPDARYASAGEMADALEKAISEGTPVPSVPPPREVPAPVIRARDRLASVPPPREVPLASSLPPPMAKNLIGITIRPRPLLLFILMALAAVVTLLFFTKGIFLPDTLLSEGIRELPVFSPTSSTVLLGEEGTAEIEIFNPSINDAPVYFSIVTINYPEELTVVEGFRAEDIILPPGSSQKDSVDFIGERAGNFEMTVSGHWWPGERKNLSQPISIEVPIRVDEVLPVSDNGMPAPPTMEPGSPGFREGPTSRFRPLNDQISAGRDGIVEMFMSNPSVNDVSITFDMIITVPMGLHVLGAQGFSCARTYIGVAAGDCSTIFTIDPGQAELGLLHVKAEKIGHYQVHLSGYWWPGDNKDLRQPISLSHPFTVSEPSTDIAPAPDVQLRQGPIAKTAVPPPTFTSPPPPPSSGCGLSTGGHISIGTLMLLAGVGMLALRRPF